MYVIEDAVWDGIVPVHRNGHQQGMHVTPALDGQQDVIGLGAVIEYAHIIILRRIDNVNLRMTDFQVMMDLVVDGRVSTGYHHQILPVEVRDSEPFFGCQRMPGAHRYAFPVSSQLEKVAVQQPFCGIAYAHQEIKLFAQRRYLL